jgi:hypothetical protein
MITDSKKVFRGTVETSVEKIFVADKIYEDRLHLWVFDGLQLPILIRGTKPTAQKMRQGDSCSEVFYPAVTDKKNL